MKKRQKLSQTEDKKHNVSRTDHKSASDRGSSSYSISDDSSSESYSMKGVENVDAAEAKAKAQ